MKRNKKISILLALTLSLWSCDLDINVDPNRPVTAEVKELLPSGQLTSIEPMANLINAITSTAVQTRVNSRYENYNVDRTTINGVWMNQLFSGGLKDLEDVITQGTEKEMWHYVGIAKLMKAYTFSIMVDLWNDIPYDDAFGPNGAVAKYESGANVYSKLLALIDDGIADLGKTSASSPTTDDLIYGGDKDKWKRMGRTLQLKMYNQTRLVDSGAKDKIQALITANSTIQTSGQDFQVTFAALASPENRIPLFVTDYVGRIDNRMSNYFYNTLTANNDPRIPYYIYNQTAGVFVGKTSGDLNGLVTFEDQNTRSVHGLYPAGGKYDNGLGGATNGDAGVKGAGVFRMMTNAMRLFIEAEAVATLGVTGSATLPQLFEQGIRAAMSKVNDLGVSPMSAGTIDSYVNARVATFNGANATEQLRMIMMEKYVLQFGNGVEQYNDWRRTGIPDNLDLALITGVTLNRFPYPSSETPPTLPINSEFVFWDK